jgi:predicted glycoside hydrolase/deacetylase ChbG (UPF0249 family)
MLIINADDWGRTRAETEAAWECWRGGSVTSVSAMVFMEDSERAAEVARDHAIDAGLHLNLTEPFTGASVPASLSLPFALISRFLTRSKYSQVIYHPLLRRAFRDVCQAQLKEFHRIYSAWPSHLDGHQHMHLCANILWGGILPRGAKVRRSFSFWPKEKSALNRGYRSWVDWQLARRHRLTDFFFDLSQSQEGGRLDRVAALSAQFAVELMTHPIRPREFRCLMEQYQPGWWTDVKLASYASL